MTGHFVAHRYDEQFYHVIVRMLRTCANVVYAKTPCVRLRFANRTYGLKAFNITRQTL